MLLVLLAAVCTPIRWIACTHAAIQHRIESAAEREAKWLNAVQAERALP